ncbi:MAG: BlaI/MecI/CopY family transcriptional regulator [bacterium]|nr:BlaI/MecI/CopY family transcriptional regulator [bacterium]
MSHHSFYFDPDGQGLSVFLGKTETRLMEIAWTKGELTVKKAMYYLGEGNDLAYTTVMTILGRLAAKGILTRKKVGRSFVYHAAIDRQEFLKQKVEAVENCLKRNFTS